MKETIEHIKSGENSVRQDKTIHYWKIAKKCKDSKKEKDLIVGVLLYNQLIEQFLKDAIYTSIVFLKVSIYPNKIYIKLDLDSFTYGQLIKYFKNVAIIDYNREIIIQYLNDIKPIRNKIVHNLFDINDIKIELKDYYEKSEELFMLLLEYYNSMLNKIYDSYWEFDFNKLLY